MNCSCCPDDKIANDVYGFHFPDAKRSKRRDMGGDPGFYADFLIDMQVPPAPSTHPLDLLAAKKE